MYIPEEYVRTGRSMNSSSPANATISSSCSRMYVRFSPRIDPLRKTFSRPVKSGWNPAPSSSSVPMRPPTSAVPDVGWMIPERIRSSVLLPEPFRPTSPTALPGSIWNETSRSAQTSVAGPRPRASTSALSERASRECTRKRRDTRSTPISPGRTVTCFLPDELGERAHEVGIRVRHLDPPQRHSELARAILRLDVDVPANLEVVGDEADRADEHVAHAASVQLAEVVEDVGAEPRLARRRLALVRERPLAHVRGLRDEPRRLEQLAWYGSPSSRVRAGSECAVKTTCAVVPRTRAASASTNGSKSCQLSIIRSSARASSARSSCSR